VRADGRKVIAMSLYGKDPRYTWGVLRNAQLVPVHLPDWTLRVYIAADPVPPQLAVPPRIVNKLRLLGVEIARVSTTGNNMAPRNWRLIVADDQSLDYFLVRDADSRLSEREAAAVRDWLSMAVADKNRLAQSTSMLHCVRDHPKHANQAIIDGLWGGRPRALRSRLNKSIADIPGLVSARSLKDASAVMSDILWPVVADVAYCHDSVSSCDRWTPLTSRHQFPTSREGREYLGQKFDQHQELVSTNGDQLKPDITCAITAMHSTLPSSYTTLRPTPRVNSSSLAAAVNRTKVVHPSPRVTSSSLAAAVNRTKVVHPSPRVTSSSLAAAVNRTSVVH